MLPKCQCHCQGHSTPGQRGFFEMFLQLVKNWGPFFCRVYDSNLSSRYLLQARIKTVYFKATTHTQPLFLSALKAFLAILIKVAWVRFSDPDQLPAKERIFLHPTHTYACTCFSFSPANLFFRPNP